ncbi:MAG TPA: hypothetical protein VFT72_07555 [Opitutaceae bacterium]|nr:hypothetical protein [Opitutaceae bacterium]
MKIKTLFTAVVLLSSALSTQLFAYENFKVAVYCRAYEVKEMADPAWLEARYKELTQQVHVDKIYLEVHRDLLMVDDKTLDAAKAFWESHGIKTAGGITYTVDESNRFETFSYANPEHRKKVQEIAEHAAKHFDEVILDDFFFTSAKSEYDWKARGDKSWTEFRLKLMADAAEDLVVKPAKKVNPKVRVVIKYPNWYEHFQALGFNLEKEPSIFDGIYTGTETRDAVMSAQHLQPYHGYSIIRYFSNIAPGRNGGGWVDTGGSRYYDRYAEQLWVTLFAKAPEITLFDIRQAHIPLDAKLRAPWQDQKTSFRYDDVMKPIALADGSRVKPTSYARVAGVAFEEVDKTLGAIGHPVGLKSYRPFHSTGEDFLQSYLGMVGLPMEIVTEFPTDESIVLLTAEAAFDKKIVDKIEEHVRTGHKVVITSGLLKALENRGIKQIAEIEDTGRVALVKTFQANWRLVEGDKAILIPQIGYRTNDSWELVSAIDGDNGWPLLHDADYVKGHLYVLTIPENFADLYNLPAPVLTAIRRVITANLPVQIDAPSKVSLFTYDNGVFTVENFRDEAVDVKAELPLSATQIEDVASGETVQTEERKEFRRFGKPAVPVGKTAAFKLAPHSFRAFRVLPQR